MDQEAAENRRRGWIVFAIMLTGAIMATLVLWSIHLSNREKHTFDNTTAGMNLIKIKQTKATADLTLAEAEKIAAARGSSSQLVQVASPSPAPVQPAAMQVAQVGTQALSTHTCGPNTPTNYLRTGGSWIVQGGFETTCTVVQFASAMTIKVEGLNFELHDLDSKERERAGGPEHTDYVGDQLGHTSAHIQEWVNGKKNRAIAIVLKSINGSSGYLRIN